MEIYGGALEPRSALDERMLTLRQRSLLAHSPAGDLIFWDAQEQLLHAVSALGGESARARAWRPQAVAPAVLRAHPAFLAQPAEAQAQILAAGKPSAERGLPFEVFELVLSSDGAMCALVGHAHAAVVPMQLLSEGAGARAAEADELPCFAALIGDSSDPPAAATSSRALVGACWHPLSCSHLVLLRAGGALEMFDVCADLERPELALDMRDAPATRDGPPHARARALALGERCGAGWACVTAYVAMDGGGIYGVCPLLPRSAHARWHVLRLAQHERLTASPVQRRWLRALARELAAGGGGGGGGGGRGLAATHARPRVQGPLAVEGGDGETRTAEPSASPTGALLLVPAPVGPRVLARARLDGSCELLLLVRALCAAWERESQARLLDGGADADDDDDDDADDQRTARSAPAARTRGSAAAAADDAAADADADGARAPLALSVQEAHVAWPCEVLAPTGARLAADEAEHALAPLVGERGWVRLLSAPSVSDVMYVRDCYGCHALHLPWLQSWAAFVGGASEVAEPPDCPPPSAHTRALLPSEADLRAAAAAARDAAARAKSRCTEDSDPQLTALPDDDEAAAGGGGGSGGGGAATRPFRLVRAPTAAAAAALEVRPQLVGACTACDALGGAGGGGLGSLFALAADGSLRALSLADAPPPPPPPRELPASPPPPASAASELSARFESTHATHLRALARAAEQGERALEGPGGVEAMLAGADFSESGLAAFQRAASALKQQAAAPLLELATKARARVDTLGRAVGADALGEVEAELAALNARTAGIEAKARFVCAYQRNLSARAASLRAILAHTCQPPLSAEEREGAMAVAELRATHAARRSHIQQALRRAEEAEQQRVNGGVSEQPLPTPATARSAAVPPRIGSEQLQELSGTIAQHESRIYGLMDLVADVEDRLSAARGTLLFDDAERALTV